MSNVKHVYLHIPFCKSLCSYCDFCKLFYDEKIVLTYLDALKKEIEEHYQKEKIETLYIGGGTPSCLSMTCLKKLFELISFFSLEYCLEFTFECNVEDITEELLIFLKEQGVNRLSIGVESVNLKLLSFMKRFHQKEQVKEKVALAKHYFTNINLDLMYALPNETMEEFKEDLSFFLSLNVPHLSCYSLILEEHTFLSLQNVSPIEEELDQAMYQELCKTLKQYGYDHYEISNFAKPSFASLHNLAYWNNEAYYGFGLSAAGYFDDIRYRNTSSMKHYLEGNYRYEVEKLSKDDTMSYEMILGLRKREGVSKQLFFKKYQEKIENVFDYRKMVIEGLLKEENHLWIPEENWYLSNEVLECFLERKDEHGEG